MIDCSAYQAVLTTRSMNEANDLIAGVRYDLMEERVVCCRNGTPQIDLTGRPGWWRLD